jgi:hypothetical protein
MGRVYGSILHGPLISYKTNFDFTDIVYFLQWCKPIMLKMGFWSKLHYILEPTTEVTFFNSGFKSDPTELFPFVVLVIAS